MTPQQAIKIAIFSSLIPDDDSEDQIEGYEWPESVDETNIDEVWDELQEADDGDSWLREAMTEFRCSGESSGLQAREFSRHYDSEEVAAKVGDRWVGWTYWSGGGKHGEPEVIDWLPGAYFLDAEEQTRTVVVVTLIGPDGQRGKSLMQEP